MSEVPGSGWSSQFNDLSAMAEAPIEANWRSSGVIVHVFTHFRLELSVFRADVAMRSHAPGGAWWAPADAIPGEALPSVFKKAIEAAVPGATRRVAERAA